LVGENVEHARQSACGVEIERFDAPQYLRRNWLSNTVFEDYDAIVEAAFAAWRKLIAQPETITSIGMREWAHVGQPL
jgi:hypothetical protein